MSAEELDEVIKVSLSSKGHRTLREIVKLNWRRLPPGPEGYDMVQASLDRLVADEHLAVFEAGHHCPDKKYAAARHYGQVGPSARKKVNKLDRSPSGRRYPTNQALPPHRQCEETMPHSGHTQSDGARCIGIERKISMADQPFDPKEMQSVTAPSGVSFEFDGAEDIAFWVSDPESETGLSESVRVMRADVEALRKFIDYWFPKEDTDG